MSLKEQIKNAHDLIREKKFEEAHRAFKAIFEDQEFKDIVKKNTAKFAFHTGEIKSVYVGYAHTCIELHQAGKSLPNEEAQIYCIKTYLELARKYLEKVPTEQKDDARVHLAWGMFYQATEEHEQAFASFDTAINPPPSNAIYKKMGGGKSTKTVKPKDNSAILKDAYFAKARLHHILGNFDDALANYTTAYGHQTDPFVLIGHAICLEEANQPQAAFDLLQTNVEKHPGNQALIFARARCMQTLGKLDDALAAFQKLAKENLQEKKYQLAVVFCLRDMRRFADALAEAAKVNDDKNATLLTLRGECYVRSGDLESGAKCYEAAVKLDESNVDPVLNHALALEESDELDAALNLYKNSENKFGTNKNFIQSYVRLLEKLGKYDLAIAKIRSLPNKTATDTRVTLTLVKCLFKSGNPQAAFDALKAAPQTPLVRIHKALHLQQANKLDDALVLFNALVTECEQNKIDNIDIYKQALLGRARCLNTMGQLDEAIEDYKKLITLTDHDENVWLSYARCLADKGQLDDADSMFAKACAFFPHSINCLLSQAINLQNMGKFDQAIRLLDAKLREANPNIHILSKNKITLKLLLALARCASEKGDHTLATTYFEMLFTYDPTNKEGLLAYMRWLETQRLYEDAESACDNMLYHHPNDCTMQLAQIRLLENTNRLDEAYKLLPALVEQNPGNIDIKLGLAHCLELLGDSYKAQTQFSQLVSQYSYAPKVKLSYAVFLYNYDEIPTAEKLFEGLRKDFPHYIPAQLKHAELLVDNNNYTRAIPIYRTILSKSPYCLAAYMGLAECHAKRGNIDAALAVLEDKETQPKLKYHWPYYVNYLYYLLQSEQPAQLEKAKQLYEQVQKEFPSHQRLLNQLHQLLSAARLVPAVTKPALPQSTPAISNTITDSHLLSALHSIQNYLKPHRTLLFGGTLVHSLLGLPTHNCDLDIVVHAERKFVVEKIRGARMSEPVPQLCTVRLGTKPVDIFSSSYDLNDDEGLLADAKQRDFTFKTLSYDIQTKNINDPTGQGLADLKAGLIRPVGDKLSNIAEDPIRMLRAVTDIATYGFKLTPEFASFIQDNAALTSECETVVVKKQLAKILAAPHAKMAVEQLITLNLFAQLYPSASKLLNNNPAWQEWFFQQFDKTNEISSRASLLMLMEIIGQCKDEIKHLKEINAALTNVLVQHMPQTLMMDLSAVWLTTLIQTVLTQPDLQNVWQTASNVNAVIKQPICTF